MQESSDNPLLGTPITFDPRTPFSHAKHTNGVPCGCWVGEGDAIICSCGAAYIRQEVETFGTFICYDCGRTVRPPNPGDRPIGHFSIYKTGE